MLAPSQAGHVVFIPADVKETKSEINVCPMLTTTFFSFRFSLF